MPKTVANKGRAGIDYGVVVGVVRPMDIDGRVPWLISCDEGSKREPTIKRLRKNNVDKKHNR